MKKINYLRVVLMTTILCLTLASCSKSKHDDDPKPEEPEEQTNPTTTDTYLTVDEFAVSQWSGIGNNSNTVELKVESKTVAKVTYTPTLVKKNTDPEPVTITINNYNYVAETGKFTGKGSDNFDYTASLKSKTKLDLKIPTGTFELTKK